MTLSADRYLSCLRSDSAAFVDAARRAGLDAPVPMCGDWSVAALVQHTGMVHVRVTETVARRATQWIRPGELPSPPADRDALFEWFEAGAARLEQTLTDAGPEVDVWNWSQA